MLDAFSLLDVVELAPRRGSLPSRSADLYFALSEQFEVDRMLAGSPRCRATTGGRHWPGWRCGTTSTARWPG